MRRLVALTLSVLAAGLYSCGGGGGSSTVSTTSSATTLRDLISNNLQAEVVAYKSYLNDRQFFAGAGAAIAELLPILSSNATSLTCLSSGSVSINKSGQNFTVKFDNCSNLSDLTNGTASGTFQTDASGNLTAINVKLSNFKFSLPPISKWETLGNFTVNVTFTGSNWSMSLSGGPVKLVVSNDYLPCFVNSTNASVEIYNLSDAKVFYNSTSGFVAINASKYYVEWLPCIKSPLETSSYFIEDPANGTQKGNCADGLVSYEYNSTSGNVSITFGGKTIFTGDVNTLVSTLYNQTTTCPF